MKYLSIVASLVFDCKHDLMLQMQLTLYLATLY